ncbi:MAG: fatty acid desaturase [Gammaproteobacteria bacterium]|nr:fatty acid desaturase [Gammaproteobacteria bacterium]MCP5199097.1 fatty acid desaturase [Gammaproteobacteria bacterium]
MQEQFEHRPLLAGEALRSLLRRADGPSSVRLVVHLGLFIALAVAIPAVHAALPVTAVVAVLLGWTWAGLFAPFHECVHGTAFATPRLNRLGAWLAGIPFMMAPAVYRGFHFEHHRHTQDPERDPELMDDPRYAAWPAGTRGWLQMASGFGLFMLKLRPLLGFSLRPQHAWPSFARWVERVDDRAALARESRVVLACWLVFLAALPFLPGGGWLLFAAWLSNALQALWVSCEHTGLPLEGSILQRTRTVESNAFVRFFVWNMNYHAEHHAWPGIPWYRLPEAHRAVRAQLGSLVPGYAALHANVRTGRNRPSADPSPPPVTAAG